MEDSELYRLESCRMGQNGVELSSVEKTTLPNATQHYPMLTVAAIAAGSIANIYVQSRIFRTHSIHAWKTSWR